MKRSLLLILALALLSCGGDAPPGEPEGAGGAETATATAADTTTASGYVENVTRAQAKAKEMAAEEGKRVEDVDDAMKDQ